jgi:hypothetical protein
MRRPYAYFLVEHPVAGDLQPIGGRSSGRWRWDRDSGRFFAFVLLACAIVCFNQL